jgi:cytochrome c oxidase subunit 3
MLKESLNLVPARRDHYKATVFFYWFMASLAMFFLASLVTYIIIRTQSFQPIQRKYEPLSMPQSFWLSSLFLIVTSILLERTVWQVRRQKSDFANWLLFAAISAVLFVVVQCFALKYLVDQHFMASDGSTKVFGMSFVLALLHGLHVVGGIVYIGYVYYQSIRGKYDHERFWAIKYCAGYWHFLDLVWIAMLITFAITR